MTGPTPIGLIGQVNSPVQVPDGTLLLAANVRIPPVGSRLWISPDGGKTWLAEMCHMLWDPAEGMMRGETMPPGEIPEKSGPDEGVWNALQKFNFGTPTLNLHPDGIL